MEWVNLLFFQLTSTCYEPVNKVCSINCPERGRGGMDRITFSDGGGHFSSIFLSATTQIPEGGASQKSFCPPPSG